MCVLFIIKSTARIHLGVAGMQVMITVSYECRFDTVPFSISKQCKDGVMTNLHCSHSLMVYQIPFSESEGEGTLSYMCPGSP